MRRRLHSIQHVQVKEAESGLSIFMANAAEQTNKWRSHRRCALIQSSTNKGYVTERLSRLAQREAGLQTLAVSEGRSHLCVQGSYLIRGKVVTRPFLTPSPGLFLYPAL